MNKLEKFARWDFRVTTEEEQNKLRELYTRSGAKSKSDFARDRLLGKPFTVYSDDKNWRDYVTLLKQYLYELNKMGVNFNQITKAINTYHTPKVGQGLLKKTETLFEQILEKQAKVEKLTEKLIGLIEKKREEEQK